MIPVECLAKYNLVKKGSKDAHAMTAREKDKITVMLTACCDGRKGMPLIVFRGRRPMPANSMLRGQWLGIFKIGVSMVMMLVLFTRATKMRMFPGTSIDCLNQMIIYMLMIIIINIIHLVSWVTVAHLDDLYILYLMKLNHFMVILRLGITVSTRI